jgi:AraC-like DNA-binding protein
MSSVRFNILPPPDILKNDVECFRIAEHITSAKWAINVSPTAVPGIVFQHNDGQSSLESIATPSHSIIDVPTLFLHGPVIEPSVMNYQKGTWTSVQVILKPHALKTLLGIDANALKGTIDLHEFTVEDLNSQLLEAGDERAHIRIFTDFLLSRFKQMKARDTLIEESLRLIRAQAGAITVKSLLERLNISERQFERRFSQTVGVSPNVYIRVRRFNEAVRLIKSRRYRRLIDVAYALNYHDQSHLIHEINAFSGITPKKMSRKDSDVYHDEAGYFYVST